MSTAPITRWAPPILVVTLIAAAGAAGAILTRGGASRSVGLASELRYRLPVEGSGSAALFDAALADLQGRLSRRDSVFDRATLAALYLRLAKARPTEADALRDQAKIEAERSLDALGLGNHRARLVLAHLAEERHDFIAALAHGEAVRRESPSHPGALALQITSLVGMGKPERARPIARSLATNRPSLSSYTLAGLAAFRAGDPQAAITHLEHAIRLEDLGEQRASAKARVLLGRAHRSTGRFALARSLYCEALRIRPRDVEAETALASLEAATGRTAAALRRYQQLLLRTEHPPLLIAIARCHDTLGEHSAARRARGLAEERLRIDLLTRDTGHRRDLAEVLLDQEGPAQAREALELMRGEATTRQDAATLRVLARARLAVDGLTAGWIAAN